MKVCIHTYEEMNQLTKRINWTLTLANKTVGVIVSRVKITLFNGNNYTPPKGILLRRNLYEGT